MLKIIWSIIKITALLVAGIWLMSQAGDLNFSFLGYTVTMKTGLFFLLLTVGFFIFLSLLNFITDLLSLPRIWRGYRHEQKNKASVKALTKGFVALAAGDVDSAAKYSKEWKRLSAEDTGLSLLLQAQISRLKGNDVEAKSYLLQLAKDKDTAFLGIKGLMISAMKQGDRAQTLQYARQAYAMHPRQPWIIKMVYDLEAQSHNWQKMLEIGPKAQKYKAISVDKLCSDQAAYELLQYDAFGPDKAYQGLSYLKSAYKINPDFLPTIIRLVQYYQGTQKRKKALSLIEKHWPHIQHPDLAKAWNEMFLAKKNDKDKVFRQYEWNKRLTELAPNSIDSYIAVAEVAIHLQMWEEARLMLMRGLKIMPTAKAYRLLTLAEKNISHQDEGIKDVLNLSGNTLPDKRWICNDTGMVYDRWYALAAPHNSFNTIVWDVPSARRFVGEKTDFVENEGFLLMNSH